MIDSHCHLDLIRGLAPVRELVDSAAQAGVSKIINIGTDLDSSRISVELSRTYDGVFATVGVHPHDAKKVTESLLSELKQLAQNSKVVAVGEIGLDYYRDLSPRKIQQKVFEQQIQLAIELNLPIVIHTRESFEDTLAIVEPHAQRLKGGVFHCFPGDLEDAHRVFDLGFIISVGGVITFKNSRMSRVAAEVPLDKVILETDAPYLTPEPHRGKTNQPEFVKHVYRKMADLKQIALAEVTKVVDRTCTRLFALEPTFGD